MKKGDVILIPFPFTNLSGEKLRPALVLHVSFSDVTVAFITTQLGFREPINILIKPDPENGLRLDSVIILHKLATIAKELIEGRLGSISDDVLREVDQKLITIFKINVNP